MQFFDEALTVNGPPMRVNATTHEPAENTRLGRTRLAAPNGARRATDDESTRVRPSRYHPILVTDHPDMNCVALAIDCPEVVQRRVFASLQRNRRRPDAKTSASMASDLRCPLCLIAALAFSV